VVCMVCGMQAEREGVRGGERGLIHVYHMAEREWF
jgi:hypothetical protein